MTVGRIRRAATLTAAAGLIAATAVLSPVAPAAAAGRVRATTVTVSVTSIAPTTPAITSTARPLTVTVALENTTDQPLTGVALAVHRGEPIGNQSTLTTSLTDASARSGGRSIEPVSPSTLTLPPHVSVTAQFRTTTSLQNDDRLCLCHSAAVYPLDVTAVRAVDGAPTTLGGARTYLPAFDTPPAAKLGVTWIWPLIDRPHRTTDGTVFTDDALVSSVSGGRLDRALQVVEAVTATVPMTLVVDPDLIDELQVMADGPYTIRAADGTVTKGVGQQVAALWLGRLRAVLTEHPTVDIEFTPLADPDVTGLTQHDRTWSATLPAAISNRVITALGGRVPTHTLAWPPGGSTTTDTLDQLMTNGADTVVLDGSRVRPSSTAGIPAALAKVRTSTGTVDALLTAPALQRLVGSALTGSSALPRLLSELAVRVAQRPDAVQNAVLAPPRYVDPSPTDAEAAILLTSTSVFSQPVSADAALQGAGRPTASSTLRSPVVGSDNLSDRLLDDAVSVRDTNRAVTSLIGGTTAGRQVLATFPDAVQRAESASWSSAGAVPSVGGGPAVGATRWTLLHTQLAGYLKSVRILNRPSASYTLASSTSPLPITIRNDSNLPVQVQMSVTTVGGLPGFSARARGTRTVAPHAKATFKIATRVQRSGRIPVQVELRTPSGSPLGQPVKLFVHSTVLGTIGVVITVVAGVVLVLALLVRFVHRILRRRSKRNAARSPARPATVPEREPAS